MTKYEGLMKNSQAGENFIYIPKPHSAEYYNQCVEYNAKRETTCETFLYRYRHNQNCQAALLHISQSL